MKARKPGHVGVDLGEWFGLAPIVVRLVKAAREIAATPKGPARRDLLRVRVLNEIEALIDWLDNALED